MRREKRILCLTLMIFNFIFYTSKSQSLHESFRYPGEWEPMESVWLGISSKSFFAGEPVAQGMINCVKELDDFVMVTIIIAHDSVKNSLKTRLEANGVNLARIRFFVNPSKGGVGTIRDTGPAFIINDKKEIMAVDFEYDSPFDMSEMTRLNTEKKDRDLAGLLNIPVVKSGVAGEGGARELNGKGTLLLVEKLELERNGRMTKEEIESEYKKVFSIKKLIWLKKGMAIDETLHYGTLWKDIYPIGSGGHIDLFCRFAGPNTILLAEVKQEEIQNNLIAAMEYERLEENYRILKHSRDQDGQPFKIIRIPAGPLITVKYALKEKDKDYALGILHDKQVGDTLHYALGTSYLNFIIANGVVITSKYWKPGRSNDIKKRDEEARKAFQKAFPDHKIVMLDIEGYNHDGAGLHCVTLNQPKAN